MTDLATQASWVLIAAWTLSILYEIYRAMFKAHVSEFDTFRSWLGQGLPLLYVVGFVTAVLVRTGWLWAVWLTLIVALIVIFLGYTYSIYHKHAHTAGTHRHSSPSCKRSPQPDKRHRDSLGLLVAALAN